MIVRVSLEYDIDIDGLDEDVVDIEGYVKEKQKECLR